MTDKEAMKLALEALELLTDTEQTFGALDYGDNAIAALKERLSQPHQEPPPFWPVVQHLLDEYGLQFIDVVAAYREATQPEQEPVGYVYSESGVKSAAIQRDLPNGTPLFITHPPQRKPLSFNEITAIEEKVYMRTTHKGKPAFEYANALIRATEAAHGIKENT
jgi:hypothetical protein